MPTPRNYASSVISIDQANIHKDDIYIGGSSSPLGLTRNHHHHQSALPSMSLLSRHRRNQRALDRIVNQEERLKAELNRLRRDITDNVIGEHRSPFSTGRKKPTKKVSTAALQKMDASYMEISQQLNDIESKKAWNQTDVKTQSERIRQVLLKKKRRGLDEF